MGSEAARSLWEALAKCSECFTQCIHHHCFSEIEFSVEKVEEHLENLDQSKDTSDDIFQEESDHRNHRHSTNPSSPMSVVNFELDLNEATYLGKGASTA